MNRRNIKNIVKKYTPAQVLVREATSNDPWGPSSSLMSEISDLTFNVVAFNEVMQLLWKRMNDKHKNWRHVYKSLVLLDYLIKTGSLNVVDQARMNILAIRTLKDFQYYEEHRDLGINVREKSKALLELLQDDELLKAERERCIAAKEKFSRAPMGISSQNASHGGPSALRRGSRYAMADGSSISTGPRRNGSSSLRMSDSTPDLSRIGMGPSRLNAEQSFSRPSRSTRPPSETPGRIARGDDDAADEELQIALALSREEHANAQKRRQEEDAKEELKLRLALEASLKDDPHLFEAMQRSLQHPQQKISIGATSSASNVTRLAAPPGVSKPTTSRDTSSYDPFADPIPEPVPVPSSQGKAKDLDFLGMDPWAVSPQMTSEPVQKTLGTAVSSSDPWGAPTTTSTKGHEFDPWASGGKTYLGFADKLPEKKDEDLFAESDKTFHVSSAVPARPEDIRNAATTSSKPRTSLSNDYDLDFLSEPLPTFEAATSSNFTGSVSYYQHGNANAGDEDDEFYMDFADVTDVGTSKEKKESVKDFLSKNSTLVDLNNIASLPKAPPVPRYRIEMTPDGRSTFVTTAPSSQNNPFSGGGKVSQQAAGTKPTLQDLATRKTSFEPLNHTNMSFSASSALQPPVTLPPAVGVGGTAAWNMPFPNPSVPTPSTQGMFHNPQTASSNPFL